MILFSNYKLNLTINIFIILQLVFIFLISNDEIIKFNENKMMKSYVDTINPEKMYYISKEIIEDSEKYDNYDNNIKVNFFNKVNNLSKENGINGVGYYFKVDAVEKKKNKECKVYYLNSTLRKIKYNLSSGKWFGNTENKPQAVIGRELSKIYKIGDYITVEDNESGKSIEAQVIGYLGKLNMISDFNAVSSDGKINNQLILSHVENVVLTNVRMIQNWDNSEPSIYGVIDVENENAINNLYKNNEVTSFDKIKKNTISEFSKDKYTSGLYILLLYMILLVSLIFIIYSDTKNKLKFMLVCYTCGYSVKRMVLDSVCSNIINFTVAVFMTIFIKIVINGVDLLYIGTANVVCILGMLAVVSVVQSIMILYNTRNLTIHKIKEYTS